MKDRDTLTNEKLINKVKFEREKIINFVNDLKLKEDYISIIELFYFWPTPNYIWTVCSLLVALLYLSNLLQFYEKPKSYIYNNFSHSMYYVNSVARLGDLFALWAMIQSRWQQLFYPNRPHCDLAIFVKVSKSFICLVKSFLGNFYKHLAILILSHCM